MARIPQEELERLKREVDLEGLVREAGVDLKGTGDNLLGLCPFHDDKNPSLVVTRSKNLWACKGACSAGGSVIDWVMRSEGVGFRHAVEILMERNGSSPVVDGFQVGSGELASPLAPGVPDEALLVQVVEYYHVVLEQSEAARSYLEARGIADPEAVSAFKLGFVDRTLGLRIPRRNSAAGVEIRDQLQRVGICRETGHEHFRGCVVVPVFDERGRVAEIYGRRVERARNAPPHLYLPGPHRGVFNLAAFRASKEIILCESIVDALTFWCAGFRNVTSSYGTNGFTDEHLEALRAYGVERVLIAYDRDQAGDKAAKKAAGRLGAEGVSCWRVLFPRGMDANDYAVKVKPASQSLAVLLRSAEHLAGPVVTRSFQNRPVAQPPADPGGASVITSREPSLPFAASPPDGDDVMSQEIAASPEPEPPRLDVPAEVSDNEVVIRLGDRRFRVRGLERNLSFEQLRVNLLVSQPGSESYHVDTFDLYSARQRSVYVKQAATELGVRAEAVKRDLGRVLLKLEELQEERIAKALEPRPEASPMSEEERAEALRLLEDPRLVERIGEAFALCGLVGEETNRLVAYLAAVSRKLSRPLAVLVQSSSAAGKSALMEAALELVPEAERVHYSAMTGQSLFYMDQADLKHKVLAIAEEEGAERASYALKLLQSEGELSIASTGKDPKTGRLTTHEYRVEGPVAILMTTTAIDLDEELLNRCVVLTVDEGRQQTRAIHERQREEETLSGWRRRRAREVL
ncbi:MAG: CHC2 zinc finger domain-containing protein, partial [Thermoanaerobaculales bacterium]|nr:CHC2 zinc finger domain-containing protein [Thermoanaerobaculales bacterium]